MSISEIKKELNKFDKKKLVEVIVDLYKKNKSVKDYFDFFVNPNETELLIKYKAKVFEAFYPKRGSDLKLKDGKQAIADFKKHQPSAELVADLMLFYVECGVRFTNDFGDINEQFYSSLEKVYLQSLTLMRNEGLLDKFKMRSSQIVDATKGIGWFFHDYLIGAYFDFYSNEEEEIIEEHKSNRNGLRQV
ncbi:MAG: DUF6155 family protein [Ferruginibacter sp.]